MHGIDGAGLSVHGLAMEPDQQRPLVNIWDRRPDLHFGDRLSASLVNRRHPDVFRCLLPACPTDWADLPGLVLSPSEEVRQRISCLAYRGESIRLFRCAHTLELELCGCHREYSS